MGEKKKYLILLVCSGNTCRSPIAERLLKAMLDASDLADRVEVISAGLSALSGSMPTKQAREVIREEGLSLDGHRARLLDQELIRRADLILTMTREHKRRIRELFSEVIEGKDHIFTLKEYAGDVEELEKKVQDISREYVRLKKKKEEFFNANKGQNDRLKERQKKLKAELEEVEKELNNLDDALRGELSAHRKKIQSFEYELEGLDIPDPFGQGLESYRESVDAIKRSLRVVYDKIVDQFEED